MLMWLLIEGRDSLGGVLLTESTGGMSLLGSNEDNFIRNSEMPSCTAIRRIQALLMPLHTFHNRTVMMTQVYIYMMYSIPPVSWFVEWCSVLAAEIHS